MLLLRGRKRRWRERAERKRDDDDGIAGCADNNNDGGNNDNFAPAGQLKSLANSGMLLRATFTLHGAGECPAYDWNKES